MTATATRTRPLVPVEWRERIRTAALFAYAAVFGAAVVLGGLPLEREQLILWICGALVLGSLWRERAWRVLVDWLPFVVLMAIYDFTRGAAETLGMPLQWTPQLEVDRALFFGEVPTVWLQERLVEPELQWWQVVTGTTYVSHFVVPFALAGVLWAVDRAGFVAWARRFLTLSYVGLATYILFPAAPPWRAGEVGLIAPVDRIATLGWSEMGLDSAQALVEKGQATVNLYAAVPSLHAAYTMLLALFLWRRVRRRRRPLLAAYPLLMCFTLVYGGEHYVSDILLGWLYAGLTMLGWGWWERRRLGGRGTRTARRTGASRRWWPARRVAPRGRTG